MAKLDSVQVAKFTANFAGVFELFVLDRPAITTCIKKPLMNRTSNLISRLAIVALAAGSLCLTSTGRAQAGDSTADNPHLRKKVEGQKAPATKLSDKDRKFIQLAANGGTAEVTDGNVAKERAQSAEVKKLAAHMVADHTRANKELGELGKKMGLGMDFNSGKARSFRKENFDGDYLATMETDHKADIKMFEAEAKSGDNPELKAWAAKTLPTLKAHLSMVQDALKKKK